MSDTVERYRYFFIYLFSAIGVVYCLGTHAFYPPSCFLNRAIYLIVAFVLFFLIKFPQCESNFQRIFFAIASAAAVGTCIYMIVVEGRIIDNFYRSNTNDFYVLLIYLVATVLILTRMSGGKIVGVMTVIATVYVLFGHYIPGLFGHPQFSNTQVAGMLLTDVDRGALGNLMGVMVRLLSIFLVFAALLLASGLGDLINAVAMRLLGKRRGGPAKIAVISSMFFGMLSGSPVANVAATGSVTIPLMKRIGYKPATAGAIETLASTGGELVPPIMGLGAFVMAEIVGISYLTVCLWGIVPAILWYWTVYWVVHCSAYTENVTIWSPPKEEMSRVMKEKIHLTLGLVAFLVFLIKTKVPETAVFWSVVFLFILSSLRKGTRPNWENTSYFLKQFAETFAGITILMSVLGVFVSSLTSTGVHIKVGLVLFGGVHNWFIVAILVFLLCVVFGMAVPVIAAYLAVVLVAAPILVEMGFLPSVVHMFVFYACCLAPITPPVAMAAYTASSISGADPMKTAFSATIKALPLWIIPFLLLRKPFFLGMNVPLPEVLGWFLIALVSCVFFVMGIVGFCRKPLSMLMRALFISIALLGIQPFNTGISIGVVVVGILLVPFLLRTKGGVDVQLLREDS
jgi:TRAP transporter 4TM/12TM fusion protein